MTTKSIQFWVDPNGIIQFADLLEKSELPNCIVGTDDDAVVVEVDYEPGKSKQLQHIADLQELEVTLHHEYLD